MILRAELGAETTAARFSGGHCGCLIRSMPLARFPFPTGPTAVCYCSTLQYPILHCSFVHSSASFIIVHFTSSPLFAFLAPCRCIRRYLTPFFASPCRSRRQARDRNEEVELQHIATEDKEQLQEREQLRRRGNEVYVNLPHNTECTAVDLAPAADLVGGGDLLQQQAGFLDQREQTQ